MAEDAAAVLKKSIPLTNEGAVGPYSHAGSVASPIRT